VFTISSCCSLSGSHKLGNNIFLLEGDRIEDRIVVYCTSKNNDCCQSGSYLIPKSYETHFEGRSYSQYVEKVENNNKWIIAQSLKIDNSIKQFWIIDKNFGKDDEYEKVQSYVYGPFDYETFEKEKVRLGIKLSFN
jgi:hypothetical protein